MTTVALTPDEAVAAVENVLRADAVEGLAMLLDNLKAQASAEGVAVGFDRARRRQTPAQFIAHFAALAAEDGESFRAQLIDVLARAVARHEITWAEVDAAGRGR